MQIKTLKFRSELSKLILKGKKTTTWRLFDDKNLSVNDQIKLIVWETKKEFAKAKIISVVEKPLKEINEEDWEGHEKFASENEMYQNFSKFYNQKVDGNTLVKIIKFKLFDSRK